MVGLYIRSIGLTNRARVFHSFRHGFKDALRRAGVNEYLNDALTDHSGVGRSYGAKKMERSFGLRALSEAVARVRYRGLDLSRLQVPKSGSPTCKRTRDASERATPPGGRPAPIR